MGYAAGHSTRLIFSVSFLLMMCLFHAPVFANPQPDGWKLLRQTSKIDHDKAVKLARAEQYNKAITLLKPYIQYPEKFPGLTSDYIVILNWSRQHQNAIQFWSHEAKSLQLPAYAQMAVADSYFQTQQYQAAKRVYASILQQFPEHQPAAVGVIRCLLKLDAYQAAYTRTRGFLETTFSNHASDALSEVGWKFYHLNQFQYAEKVFYFSAEQNEHHFQTNIGLIYSLIRLNKMDDAARLLAKREKAFGKKTDYLYAKAFFDEHKGDFWGAVQNYEQILNSHPADRVARKEQLVDLSKLGATSQAEIEAKQYLPHDQEFRTELQHRKDINQLHWGSHDKTNVIRALQERKGHYSFDYIAALAHDNQTMKVIGEYERLQAEKTDIPNWLKPVIADAYMETAQQEKALALYEDVLHAWPGSQDAMLGKFYALSELQRWQEADGVLKEMERSGWINGKPPVERLNEARVDAAIARGSWLIEQQRLPEAEAHFAALLDAAPGNVRFKKAMADVYKLRGWKRRALEEFQIINSLEFLDIEPPLRLGLSDVLYTLKQKVAAHEILSASANHYPNNFTVARLQRDFQVQEMRDFNAGFKYENSRDGAIDKVFHIGFQQPLSLYTNLLFNEDIRRSSQHQLQASFDRFGIGIEHDFNSDWYVKAQVSGDHGTHGDMAVLSEIRWTPDDYWSFDTFYHSYDSDIDIRARVFNIYADQLGANVRYRWSDWRDIAFQVTRSGFSDGNTRLEGTVNYGQNLYAEGDWLAHVNAEVYFSSNSLLNRPYFNPEHSTSASATLRVNNHLWHRSARMSGWYYRSFLHYIELTLGRTWQAAFHSGSISRVVYGQDIDFSDTQSLQWRIQWGRQPYDGVQVRSYIIEGDYQWRF